MFRLAPLIGFALTAAGATQQPTSRVESFERRVCSWAIEQDEVPWTFLRIEYAALPWDAAAGAVWGRPAGVLELGGGSGPATIDSGSFVQFGPDGGGFDGSDEGPSALVVRFRDRHDPPDDAELWLEATPPGDHLGCAVDVTHQALPERAECLSIRIVTADPPFAIDEDGARVARARLQIDFGPHRLGAQLELELPSEVPTRSGTRFPAALRRALEDAVSVEVFELHGEPDDSAPVETRFHDYVIHARRTSEDRELHRRVASLLTKAALLGPRYAVDCFEPELGFRIAMAGGPVELMLSSSCACLLVHRAGSEPEAVHVDEETACAVVRLVDAACGFERMR